MLHKPCFQFFFFFCIVTTCLPNKSSMFGRFQSRRLLFSFLISHNFKNYRHIVHWEPRIANTSSPTTRNQSIGHSKKHHSTYPEFSKHLSDLISRNCDLLKSKHVGDLYEYVVVDTLNQLSFAQVAKTGKTGDGGVDFRGILFPSSSLNGASLERATSKKRGRPKKTSAKNELGVVGQCKCKTTKVGPADINSFIGALNVSSYPENTIGLFVSPEGITSAAMTSFFCTSIPMINVIMKPAHIDGGDIFAVKFHRFASMMPNHRAKDVLKQYGLEIVDVHQKGEQFSILKEV